MNRTAYNNQRKNKSAFKRGFESLRKYADGMSEVVMRNMARDGLNALLYEHDTHESNMHHATEKNTLAYALAHNGVLVESGYHNGGEDDLPGDALENAIKLACEQSGWCAVILSDLNGGWYNVALEEDLLNAARGDIQDNWGGFFGNEYLTPGAVPKPS
jgi:hypothetical protein